MKSMMIRIVMWPYCLGAALITLAEGGESTIQS